jgi:hypothetical protein
MTRPEAQRNAELAYDERQKQRGMVKVGVRVPEHRRADIVEIARKMRDEEEARGEQESEG